MTLMPQSHHTWPAAQAAGQSQPDGSRLLHTMTWSAGASTEQLSDEEKELHEQAERLVPADNNFMQDIMAESDPARAEMLYRHHSEKQFYQLQQLRA